MKRVFLTVAAILLTPQALADTKMKAGLWEVQIIKQVVDGKDQSAEIAKAQAQMQQMLASMSPQERKQMEQMMGTKMAGNNLQQVCISPEMAASDKPAISDDPKCQSTNYQRSGNTISFEFNCPGSSGKGEVTMSGNTATSKMDSVHTDKKGRHTMHAESKMKYLGADCKGIKPLDQVARDMKK